MAIIEFLKKIIKVKDNDLSFLKVGDIIWARRYQTEEEKNKIKKGHQISPYVIIKKKLHKVYALQCTSNPHQEIKWKMIYYPLGRLNYDFNKNTYINCTAVVELKKIQFVEMIGRLSLYDLNQLKKQLYILKNSTFPIRPNIEDRYLNYNFTVGDIILFNGNKYYINKITSKEYETYRLRQHLKKGKTILINNTYYSFIFEKTVILNKKDKYILIDTFNTGEIENIDDYRNDYLSKRMIVPGIPKSFRVGALIEYDNNMYYIYDEENNYYLTYRVFAPTIYEKGMAALLIKKGIYYTYFNIEKIQKSNLIKYKVRRCASIEEIEYNKNIFNSSKTLRNKKRKELFVNKLNGERKTNDFVPMVILRHNITGKYYLIISLDNNVMELVNINDLSDLFYFEISETMPFAYYRVMDKNEFDKYLKKVKEFKEVALTLQR